MSLVYWAMHYYSYIHIKKDFALSRVPAVFLKVFYCMGGISYFAGRMIYTKWGSIFLLTSGEIWMGMISISVSAFAARDFLSLFIRGKAKALTSGAVAVTLIMTSAAMINATQLAIRHITLICPLLSSGEEYRIAALSDLHLADNKSLLWLENTADKINSFNPDAVILAGDLFEGGLKTKRDSFIAAFRKIRSRDGVFAVPGNHEFYAGVKNFESFAKAAGIKVLRNENTVAGGKIIFAGIDDEATPDELDKALPRDRAGMPVVLLSHRGEIFPEAALRNIFLQFSGHTHDGQIPFFNILVKIYFKYPYGLYSEGHSYLYTSSGAGTWGPPMRLFSKSEIVCFTIKSRHHPE